MIQAKLKTVPTLNLLTTSMMNNLSRLVDFERIYGPEAVSLQHVKIG
jgi:hypothetical protein